MANSFLRLEEKWRKEKPLVSSKDFWDSMVIQRNSFDIDQQLLVCGLSHVGEGGVKVTCSKGYSYELPFCR